MAPPPSPAALLAEALAPLPLRRELLRTPGIASAAAGSAGGLRSRRWLLRTAALLLEMVLLWSECTQRCVSADVRAVRAARNSLQAI
jgi:hypothetical protein